MRDFPGAALIRKLRGDTPHPGPHTMARDLMGVLNAQPVTVVKSRDTIWRQAKSVQYDRGNMHEGLVFDIGDRLVKVSFVPIDTDPGEYRLTVLTRDK